jgi:hypothetical protein
MNVVWSPLAAQRAMEAVDYIAQDRPRTAEIWLEKRPTADDRAADSARWARAFYWSVRNRS